MKGEIKRSEIKNIQGRQMGSSRTQHVANYKSNAKSALVNPMHLRSAKNSREKQNLNLDQIAKKKAEDQAEIIKAFTESYKKQGTAILELYWSLSLL